ncbi:MAG: transglycosylase domain-containing protein [Proteobacteria bacterium]|nr:transglycosylase domain-containing protein [Pseudomonadota bacterium]
MGALGLLLAFGSSLPAVGRWYLRRRLLVRVAARLGRTVEVGAIRLRLGRGSGRVRLEHVVVRGPHDPPAGALMDAEAVELDVPWRALLTRQWRGTRLTLQRPRWRVWRRAGGADNVSDLRARWRRAASSAPGAARSVTARGAAAIEVHDGRLQIDDQRLGFRLRVDRVEAHLRSTGALSAQGEHAELRLRGWPGRLLLGRVSAERAAGEKLAALPRLRVAGGEAEIIARLGLSGISGTIAPRAGGEALDLALSGSYGGASAILWRATGSYAWRRRSGELLLEAARFELGRIREVLRATPVILPERTRVDGRLLLRFRDGALAFAGRMAVEGLNLFHPGLARVPVLGLSLRLALAGTYAAGQLDLSKLELESRGVALSLSGTLDRSAPKPVLDARLVLPGLPCQAVLDALPAALTPRLQGFRLGGSLAVDLSAHIDFARLAELKLSGRLGLDACEVLDAPASVRADRFEADFEHLVEVRPDEWLTLPVGPDNPDFVPYRAVSPHLVNALLTTEDAAFFRHRGFIPSQFERALARNLEQGSFRVGASTITMQTVKNLLLSPEKTLARKLQEVFLVWYLEQQLSKERLMEIYLNVIELGPGIYGIGAASRHFFGKSPAQLTPLEAAFFASILPAPRRRYVQWCRGALDARWDRYVRRVLRRVCAKGLVDAPACEASAEQSITFARDLSQPTPAECEQQIDEGQRNWEETRRRRLVEAIRQAAPEKLPLYAP